MRHIAIMLSLLLLVSVGGILRADQAAPAPVSKTATTPAEAELGKKTAEDIEKEYKLINDEKVIAKLNAMAKDLAPFTQRPDVVYNCKIIDSSEINAMSIPGGTIYFTKGLINAAESDYELAGVLAHEMAHNSLYHSKRMMERQRTGSIAQVIAVIGAIYANGSAQANDDGVSSMHLIAISEMVKQAILNGYSVDLETEADYNAVQYLYKSKKFDPVGLYSVILGFRQMESLHAKQDYGYLKNHPDPEVRQAAIKKELDELGVPINLWNVVNFRARVVPPEAGKTGYTLQLGSVTLFTYTASSEGKDAKARAEAAADAVNRRLTKSDEEIQRFEVRSLLSPDGKTAQVRMRSTTVITLTEDDVDTAAGETLDEVATRVKDSIQSAFFNEKVKRGA